MNEKSTADPAHPLAEGAATHPYIAGLVVGWIGKIFDCVTGNENTPPLIKNLILCLKTPITNAALADKSFFVNNSHPVRLLLKNFARLLENFNAFAEELSLAQRMVDLEIAKKLQNQDAPDILQSFLQNHWKSVLVRCYLERDETSWKWNRALDIMDKLIWTITPTANECERQKKVRVFSALLEPVKQSLESVSLDADSIEALLRDLDYCHVDAWRSSLAIKHDVELDYGKDFGKDGAWEFRITNDSRRLAKHSKDKNIQSAPQWPPYEFPKTLKDAELADQILAIKAQLPDISNVDIEEVVM